MKNVKKKVTVLQMYETTLLKGVEGKSADFLSDSGKKWNL